MPLFSGSNWSYQCWNYIPFFFNSFIQSFVFPSCLPPPLSVPPFVRSSFLRTFLPSFLPPLLPSFLLPPSLPSFIPSSLPSLHTSFLPPFCPSRMSRHHFSSRSQQCQETEDRNIPPKRKTKTRSGAGFTREKLRGGRETDSSPRLWAAVNFGVFAWKLRKGEKEGGWVGGWGRGVSGWLRVGGRCSWILQSYESDRGFSSFRPIKSTDKRSHDSILSADWTGSVRSQKATKGRGFALRGRRKPPSLSF